MMLIPFAVILTGLVAKDLLPALCLVWIPRDSKKGMVGALGIPRGSKKGRIGALGIPIGIPKREQ